MTAVAGGDRTAFADLCDELGPHVFAIMTLLANDRDAHEAAEEAMNEMWRQSPRYSPSLGPARDWCLDIAFQHAIRSHHIRRPTRHLFSPATWHGERDDRVEQAPVPRIEDPTDAIIEFTSSGADQRRIPMFG